MSVPLRILNHLITKLCGFCLLERIGRGLLINESRAVQISKLLRLLLKTPVERQLSQMHSVSKMGDVVNISVICSCY